MKPFWSLHTHSRYSANDAMPHIDQMVAKAVELDYPALGLTDHGTVAGAVQLYKAARKAGIEPLPGEEFYFTPDREHREQSNYHLTVAAYSEPGYRNLVGLHNLAQKNFFYRPRIDIADLAGLSEDGRTAGLVVSTGCYFGMVTQTLVNRGHKAAERLVAALAMWFPRLYVELHNHEVQHPDGGTDYDIVNELVDIADRLGLPYIIAADAHYLNAEDQNLHDALKSLVSFSDDPSEAIFPGGPYSIEGTEFFKPLFEPHVLERACDNLADLAERAHLRLPELEEFRMRVPDVTVTGDAQVELEERAIKALGGRFGFDIPSAYEARMNSELEVIRASGFADYLLLVAEVCDFMRAKDIWYQTRGSAEGCLVNWLLGITEMDPIHYDLRMDRFMSTDRMKPPDVDIDVEHLRRDEVIAYLSQQWTVRQIGSHMKYSVSVDEDAAMRDEDSSKGSLVVKYFSTARKQGVPIKEWGQIPDEDQATLRALGSRKLIAQAGTHAAGYLVSPDEAAARQIPLTWIASRKAMVTTYAMKDVEALGFVKLDLLGLRTMTAIKVTCDALGWSWADFLAIPLEDKAVLKRIGQGDTAAMFQLDGRAMTRGCKELKPKNLEDIIAAQALYRPATMQSGATKDFLARRAKQAEVPVRHPDIMAETSSTYGVLLYQEQVIGCMKRLGMHTDELTAILAAIKASNEYSAGAAIELQKAKPRIRELAEARKWSEDDIEWLLDALVAYGEYSFNRAHAAKYGITAYRTAYLAEYHPVEFWLGVVRAYEAHDREKIFVSAARRHSVRVLPPHVNFSQASYSLDVKRNAIRRGLVSVKNVGTVTANELAKHQPFESLADLAARVVPGKVSGSKKLGLGMIPENCGGAISALADVGALEGLT